MKSILLSLIFFCVLAGVVPAQDLPYAKEVVGILASDSLRGRGYVGRGDRKAAEFIRGEFRRLGLKSFDEDYFQLFETPVNIFPGKITLIAGKKKLNPGADYLVEAGSPSLSGKFVTLHTSADQLLDEASLRKTLQASQGKVLVLHPLDGSDLSKEQREQASEIERLLKYHPQIPARAVVSLTDAKLTWSASPVQYPRPVITLRKDSTLQLDRVGLDIEAEFIESYTTQNVIGYVEGRQDSLVVLTAHYDHLGMMGKEAIFPGANDNASGVALLLNLAQHYLANPPEYTTVFIAFGGEEIGLVGSQYFVEHPLFELEKIRFLVNFDISGTGDDGIQVVNGSIFEEEFTRLKAINQEYGLLPEVKIRGEACNSDHCMFYRKGVPCFFIYTLGGIQAYHDIYDRAETLPLTEYEDYFRLVTRFIESL